MPLFLPPGVGGGITEQQAVNASIAALASDGGDGDVTITGGTTSATRDMYYNNLVIDGTGTLVMRGWSLFFRTLSVQVGGVLHWDGVAAVGSAAGANYAGGSLPTNIVGVAGGLGVGVIGTASNNTNLPRAGVLGTTYRGGLGGAGIGGAGGTFGAIAAASTGRQARRGSSLTGAGLSGSAVAACSAGGSGGAGGGTGAITGGGSGSGGGFGHMVGGTVNNLGRISARGGDGGAGAGVGAGGGAGAGGGTVLGAIGQWSGLLPNVLGGLGGLGGGTGGLDGGAGNPGDYFIDTYKAV